MQLQKKYFEFIIIIKKRKGNIITKQYIQTIDMEYLQKEYTLK